MAYTSSDAATRLEAVREAINRCLTSQAYGTADGRNQQMAQLRDLRVMEKELQDEVANSGGGTQLGVYSR